MGGLSVRTQRVDNNHFFLFFLLLSLCHFFIFFFIFIFYFSYFIRTGDRYRDRRVGGQTDRILLPALPVAVVLLGIQHTGHSTSRGLDLMA